MSRPNLQIALDHNDLEHALGDVMKVGDVVDIIEVGTILCLQEGQIGYRNLLHVGNRLFLFLCFAYKLVYSCLF
ncbi:hypothetical protein EfmAA610_11110 [Enterococcus faecium]|nr:hypothetical protein EfmAA610_11110 [Enterococcus faecium]